MGVMDLLPIIPEGVDKTKGFGLRIHPDDGDGYYLAFIIPLDGTDNRMFIGCMPMVCAKLSVMRDTFIDLMKAVFTKFCADLGADPDFAGALTIVSPPEEERKH
jgi:hypothetical protein